MRQVMLRNYLLQCKAAVPVTHSLDLKGMVATDAKLVWQQYNEQRGWSWMSGLYGQPICNY